MAAMPLASRPHSTVLQPCRAISAASAVPQEPAPTTATVAGACATTLGLVPSGKSGVASGFGAGQAGAIGGLLGGALAQAFGVQGFEVDRLQEEWRETAGLDQVADQLARVRVQHGRAMHAEHAVERGGIETGQTEHTGLLHFGDVDALVADGAGQ